MLLVERKDDIQQYYIPIVDFHTHIGKVTIETTTGKSQRINRPQDILELYEKLTYELYKRFSSKPDNYYIKIPEKASLLVNPLHPFINSLYSTLMDKKTQGLLVDHVVTFPFNDIYHLETKPKFIKSNDFVRKNVHKFNFTFRFIPFCRVDVTDGIQACQEIENSVKNGSQGLKLHPLSQGWIDKIRSPETIEVLRTAGKSNLPIIFDVPNKSVANDITETAIEARKSINDDCYNIKVILGHTGFDYSSSSIFSNLENDDMFCETSGMRGKDVEIFFKNIMNVKDWNSKILFGTDHNYFSVLQAADFVTYLFSNKFIENLESFTDFDIQNDNPLNIVSNILGGNALRIIPPKWHNNKMIEELQTANEEKRKKKPKKNIKYQVNEKKLIELIKSSIKNNIVVSIDSLFRITNKNTSEYEYELYDLLSFNSEKKSLLFEVQEHKQKSKKSNNKEESSVPSNKNFLLHSINYKDTETFFNNKQRLKFTERPILLESTTKISKKKPKVFTAEIINQLLQKEDK